ncbi:BrnA antitoxin family protein [Nitrosomonas sp.]
MIVKSRLLAHSEIILDSGPQNFRATGSGWQTRMDESLMEWIREHRS